MVLVIGVWCAKASRRRWYVHPWRSEHRPIRQTIQTDGTTLEFRDSTIAHRLAKTPPTYPPGQGVPTFNSTTVDNERKHVNLVYVCVCVMWPSSVVETHHASCAFHVRKSRLAHPQYIAPKLGVATRNHRQRRRRRPVMWKSVFTFKTSFVSVVLHTSAKRVDRTFRFYRCSRPCSARCSRYLRLSYLFHTVMHTTVSSCLLLAEIACFL